MSLKLALLLLTCLFMVNPALAQDTALVPGAVSAPAAEIGEIAEVMRDAVAAGGSVIVMDADGKVVEADYATGDTMHFQFKKGEAMTHDLENIGDSELCFTTVEFLDSENRPLF